MTRPLLLDLFCGAGGAAMGYHRAGFDVVGVDNVPQPHYPFAFHQDDALAVLASDNDLIRSCEVIHASPPCQSETTMSNRHRGKGTLADTRRDLLTPTIELVKASGLPWVVENVPGARKKMPDPFTLHGGMFGLSVYRPRLFSTNAPLMMPAQTRPPVDPIGVYGKVPDGRRLWDRSDGTTQRAAASLGEAQTAMGMSWGTWDEVKEAVPPAYTNWIGRQLVLVLGLVA